MSDEITTSKDVVAAEPAGEQHAAGTNPASHESDPTYNHPGFDAEVDDEDYFTSENVAARRKASGIEFISHAEFDPDLIKGSDGIPSNLRVGREGEEPEVRADLHTADGPRSELQVDVHVTPEDVPTVDRGLGEELAAASKKPALRPEESASDAPNKENPDGGEDALEVKGADILSSAKERKDTSEFDDNVVVDDPDNPVIGHIDEEGNVHADNKPATVGEFVIDPQAVVDSAEANEVPVAKSKGNTDASKSS